MSAYARKNNSKDFTAAVENIAYLGDILAWFAEICFSLKINFRPKIMTKFLFVDNAQETATKPEVISDMSRFQEQ